MAAVNSFACEEAGQETLRKVLSNSMDPQVAAALAAGQQQISQQSPMSQPSTPTKPSLDNFQEDETSSNASTAGSNDSSTGEPRCRFCLESSETTSSLIRPCRC